MNKNLVEVTEIHFRTNGKDIVVSPADLRMIMDQVDPNLLVREPHRLLIDPNSEYWPERWEIKLGPLCQTATITINV